MTTTPKPRKEYTYDDVSKLLRVNDIEMLKCVLNHINQSIRCNTDKQELIDLFETTIKHMEASPIMNHTYSYEGGK